MSVFGKMKEYFLEIKKNRQNCGYIRLNHLEKTALDKDGTYNILHTQGNVYELPKNMEYDQAFMVISFIKDKVAKDLKLGHDDLRTMLITNKILEGFHFKRRFNYNECDVVDLTMGNNDIKFPKKDAVVVDKYFWYSTDITKKQVSEIYRNRVQKVDFSPITKDSVGDALCMLTEVIPMKEPRAM